MNMYTKELIWTDMIEVVQTRRIHADWFPHRSWFRTGDALPIAGRNIFYSYNSTWPMAISLLRGQNEWLRLRNLGGKLICITREILNLWEKRHWTLQERILSMAMLIYVGLETWLASFIQKARDKHLPLKLVEHLLILHGTLLRKKNVKFKEKLLLIHRQN